MDIKKMTKNKVLNQVLESTPFTPQDWVLQLELTGITTLGTKVKQYTRYTNI